MTGKEYVHTVVSPTLGDFVPFACHYCELEKTKEHSSMDWHKLESYIEEVVAKAYDEGKKDERNSKEQMQGAFSIQ